MRSSFSQTRIAYVRLPRILARPMPWIRLITGRMLTLAKL